MKFLLRSFLLAIITPCEGDSVQYDGYKDFQTEKSMQKANIQGGGKTVHVVFKYISRRLL
jgi:hypothetical protein